MAKRMRRPVERGEYEDPDERLETLGRAAEQDQHEDAMERSLCEDTVLALKTRPFRAVSPDATVEKVVRAMSNLNIACIMVVDEGKLVGVFSDHDFLLRVYRNFAKLRKRPISEVMTRNPAVAYDAALPAQALNQMSMGDFRHIPILDVDDKVVGILGPRRVIAYLTKFLS